MKRGSGEKGRARDLDVERRKTCTERGFTTSLAKRLTDRQTEIKLEEGTQTVID